MKRMVLRPSSLPAANEHTEDAEAAEGGEAAEEEEASAGEKDGESIASRGMAEKLAT